MTKRELVKQLEPFDDATRIVIKDIMHFDIAGVVPIAGGVALVADFDPIDEPEGGLRPPDKEPS